MAPTDYKDGNATSTTNGPFVHQYYDKDGNLLGQFALTITPPPVGSTVVVINSKGTVVSNSSISSTVQTKLAIPSLAQYAVVANDNMRFGSGTVVYGQVMSNEGIHFDGVAHNVVSSALASYVDPDFPNSGSQYGVYTTAIPSRPPLPPPIQMFFSPAGNFRFRQWTLSG